MARFNQPSAIAVDSSGNLYVADTGNSAIRRIMPASNNWVTTTLTTNLLAAGITIADSNNLYIACAGDDTLRKLTQSGGNWTVSIVAGSSGKSGSADGTAAARFNFPSSIALATNGTLFVADSLNNTIRKIASDGTVSTFAGLAGGPGSTDGLQVQARFNAPLGLAFAPDGNCYIADSENNTIRRVTSAGAVQTIAGVATNLPGTHRWKRHERGIFQSDGGCGRWTGQCLRRRLVQQLDPEGGSGWNELDGYDHRGPGRAGLLWRYHQRGRWRHEYIDSIVRHAWLYKFLRASAPMSAAESPMFSEVITNTPLYDE